MAISRLHILVVSSMAWESTRIACQSHKRTLSFETIIRFCVLALSRFDAVVLQIHRLQLEIGPRKRVVLSRNVYYVFYRLLLSVLILVNCATLQMTPFRVQVA